MHLAEGLRERHILCVTTPPLGRDFFFDDPTRYGGSTVPALRLESSLVRTARGGCRERRPRVPRSSKLTAGPKTLPDRGREVFDRAAQHTGSQTDSRCAIRAIVLLGQTQKPGHGRRKLEPLVAAAEVVRDREVDKISLYDYQLGGNATEHMLGGNRVHLPHAYTGFALVPV